MKLDLHVHCGLSPCSKADVEVTVNSYAESGVNFVLTNHYAEIYTTAAGGAYPESEYADIYIDRYNKVKKYADELGVKTFFGMEIGIVMPDCPYAEFLLYGITPDILKSAPHIYGMGQKQLYEFCASNGIALIQAHPYRKEQGHFPHDPEFMDGVEINCHPVYLREESRVRDFAATHNLRITAGSDFHVVGGQALGGIEVDASNEKELAKKILAGEYNIFLR